MQVKFSTISDNFLWLEIFRFLAKKKEIVFQQAQKMDEMLNTEN